MTTNAETARTIDILRALFVAAADKHPDWKRIVGGWTHRGDEELTNDVLAQLVRWFVLTHPGEARAIVIDSGPPTLGH